MAYDGTLVTDYLRKTHQTALLSVREKQLVGLAVTLTRGCQVCTRNRLEKARSAGRSDEVLNALAAIASAVNAGVTAATARESFPASSHEPCGELCATEVAAAR